MLTSQISSLEQQAEAVPRLQRQLHTAHSQHEECEVKLHDMIEENKGIQEQVRVLHLENYRKAPRCWDAGSLRHTLFTTVVQCSNAPCLQVTKLQQEVKRIRTESSRKGKQKQENRVALEQVHNLQSELSAAHGGQEELKMKAHAMDRKLEAAASREAKLKTELQCAREEIDSLQREVQKQENKVPCSTTIIVCGACTFIQAAALGMKPDSVLITGRCTQGRAVCVERRPRNTANEGETVGDRAGWIA